MSVAFHTCMAVAALLLIPLVQGQSRSETPKPDPSKQSAGPKSSSQIEQPTPQHITSPGKTVGQIVATVASGNSTTSEPKESFSQLTLFLFASGLGLFIALLGWSDQIRGIDKDTKDLEERFLKKTRINKAHFVEIIRPESPDEQLVALTQAVNDGKITTKVSVDVLQAFAEYVSKWSRLERLSDWKYNLTIALTFALFIAGTASLFTSPAQQLQLLITIRVELIVLILPMALIGLLLIIIVCSARKEKELRSLLNSMSDMV